MNFADRFTATDARAQVLHNTNASLLPQAFECINDATEAEMRDCGLECSNQRCEADLLAAVLRDRGFVVAVVDCEGDGTDARYHLHIAW